MREVNRDNSETAWERAKAHYRIIQEHAFASICIAVPLRPIAQAVDDFGLPPWMKNPYYLAWKGILSVYMGYNKKVGLNTPIDFIFDDQTEKKKVLAAWDTLYQNTPQRYKRFIPNMPTFRSDDDFLPLQAADLIAWWMRKRYLENGTVLNLGPIVPWEKSDPDYAHLHGQLSEDAIRQILKSEASEKYRIRASFVLRSPSRTAMPEA